MIRVQVGEQTYQFDDSTMLNTEAMALKKFTGLGIRELMDGIGSNDPEAYTALVWLSRRRAGEGDLRYSAVEFDLAAFDWEPVDEDGRVLRYHPDGSIASRDGVLEPTDPTESPSDGSAAS